MSGVGELLAYAHQMELEAQERYGMLADQMQVHNNPELEKLFRDLARIEGLHAADIAKEMKDRKIPDLTALDFEWPDAESPEAVDFGDVHYQMVPWQALQLALRAEQKAQAFFEHFVATTGDAEARRFAEEFAGEEEEHVALVLKELRKYPAPSDTPADDLDPPVGQD